MMRYLDAQHYDRHPAHGTVLVGELRGRVAHLAAGLSDDPALAAEDILAALPAIRGQIERLQVWADDTAHQSFAPTPDTGATV